MLVFLGANARFPDPADPDSKLDLGLDREYKPSIEESYVGPPRGPGLFSRETQASFTIVWACSRMNISR